MALYTSWDSMLPMGYPMGKPMGRPMRVYYPYAIPSSGAYHGVACHPVELPMDHAMIDNPSRDTFHGIAHGKNHGSGSA